MTPNGQLLIDLCPQFEKIIGSQPPVEPVDEEQVRPRLHQVVIRFLEAICQPEHPVVIFLDDMQWISPNSCILWQSILSTVTLKNLLVVGAYRDNEIGPEHPVCGLIQDAENTIGLLTHLHLQSLEISIVNKLIAVALASDPDEVFDLSSVVYQKTNGNPYFTTQLVKSLNKDQLLTFDATDQKWRWDIATIEKYLAASNVVDLFVNELRKFDEDTQKMLQYAALIGRQFDVATLLSVVGQDKASSLAYSLWVAMKAGLIHPLDENYRYLMGETTSGLGVKISEQLPSLAILLKEQILFEFQHDWVQQAAIAMLDERQMMNTSLQMGRLLLEKARRRGEESIADNLLVIVDRLDTGSALIEDPAEAVVTAQLNLLASKQARAAAAYGAASRYLVAGMKLLPSGCWQDHYTLTIDLFTAGAEVAFL